MKIALCASEAVPFAKTGGLADVCGALPLALEALGEEPIVIMPKYQSACSSAIVVKRLNDDFDWTIIGNNIKVFFVKADMFLREALYGNRFGDYPDNLRRFSYFCKKALELFKIINFYPDVIHCHDWQTALIPLFLKACGSANFTKDVAPPRSLLTIHNIAYQGIFPKEQMFETGLDSSYFSLSGLEYYDKINLLKGGILYADLMNTVSPNYSKEILTKEFGCGLEGVLKEKGADIRGIINGVDYKVWNPQTDTYLFRNYSLHNLPEKSVNKIRLQETCGLAKNDKLPLMGFVGRLVAEEGVELICMALLELCRQGLQTVILGTGPQKYESALSDIAREFPGLVSFNSGFNDELAHRIFGGCDILLMPSKMEPCGINQLISFKYGTVPVCYKTGGLADTVIDYRPDEEAGSGFMFNMYTEGAFILAIERAAQLFSNKQKWHELLKSIMRLNFSWKESAKAYIELYLDVMYSERSGH